MADEPHKNSQLSLRLWIIMVLLSVVLLVLILGVSLLSWQMWKLQSLPDRMTRIEQRVDRLEQSGIGSSRELWKKD